MKENEIHILTLYFNIIYKLLLKQCRTIKEKENYKMQNFNLKLQLYPSKAEKIKFLKII